MGVVLHLGQFFSFWPSPSLSVSCKLGETGRQKNSETPNYVRLPSEIFPHLVLQLGGLGENKLWVEEVRVTGTFGLSE